jgi:hypothetical protein
MDIETNNAMLRNVAEPIVRTASNFQHMSILQGTKIYGVHLHPIPCGGGYAAEDFCKSTVKTVRRVLSSFGHARSTSEWGTGIPHR